MPKLSRRTALFALALALGIGAGFAHENGNGHAAPPGAAGKKRSALAVSAAISPAGALWLIGLDASGQLYTQTSDDLGHHWQAPRTLDIGGDTVSAEGENRPKIAFGADGNVVIAYTRPLSRPYTGEIRMLRSVDGGERFSAPATVHRDRQLITHRFESIAFDRRGVLHTVWIDKRDQAAAGKAGYRGAAIYRNESRDGGASFGPDIKLADHSCECCRIALAPAPGGGMAAFWRHVFAPEIRDHAFAVLGTEAAAPVRATEDDWTLAACPHHGPAIAVAERGGYHAVWFGERAGQAAVRYGRLGNDGRPAGAPLDIPDAYAEHADIAARDGMLVIAWRSFDGMQTRLRAWVSNDDGAHFRLRDLASSAEENDYPRLLSTPAGIRVLWRTTSATHVLDPAS
ncbi:MAG: exo-alpha-sialidase [Rhodocyclaceae bacterium]|jgi:hypothetical protein|nr:exo-alpha-sialidase [Rhodocyclaceae bacterium]